MLSMRARSATTRDDGQMWVRVMDWLIADGEPPLPEVGSVLAGVGLRVRGEVQPAPSSSLDGIVEAQGGRPHEVVYRLTGRVNQPRDYKVSTGRQSRRRHAGAEFVLTVGSDRYQVQAEAWSRDVRDGTPVTVTGRLAVVGAYEWDAFGLSESRADWVVRAVASADHGDTMLDLIAAASG